MSNTNKILNNFKTDRLQNNNTKTKTKTHQWEESNKNTQHLYERNQQELKQYVDLTNIPNWPVGDIVVPAQQFARPNSK